MVSSLYSLCVCGSWEWTLGCDRLTSSVQSMTFFHICDSFKFNDYMFYTYILCVSVVVESETGLWFLSFPWQIIFFHICDSFKFNDNWFHPYILCVSVVVERVIGLWFLSFLWLRLDYDFCHFPDRLYSFTSVTVSSLMTTCFIPIFFVWVW